MIYHKKCNNMVLGMIELKFLYSIGIGKLSTSMGLSEIFSDENNSSNIQETKYYCPFCREIIEDISDLIVLCNYCGDFFPPDKIFNPLEKHSVSAGSIGCKKCISKYISEEIYKLIPLSEILEKVYIGKDK